MAPDVIDLISSSPPPTSKPMQARHRGDDNNHLQRHAGHKRFSAEARPPVAPTALSSNIPVADLTGLSDFDFSDDDIDLLIAARPPPKRQRTASPSRPTPATVATQASSSRPPLIVGRNAAQPGRRELEPIEVSSSMEQPTPRPRQHGREASSRFAAPVVSSDPFASSPEPVAVPPVSRGERQKQHAVDLPSPDVARSMSVDPFESSPMRNRRSPKQPVRAHKNSPPARGAVSPVPEEDIDPFASSPEPGDGLAAADKSQRTAAPPSPTSLSPARTTTESRFSRSGVSRPNPAPRSFTRVLSETNVINIDDSDSDGSDGSDLADIASIDITKRPLKPRSPLRRSRSDNIIGKSRLNNSSGRSGARTSVDKAAREAAKAAEKERKKRERKRNKEAKAREKERAAALAEVNKLRTDKKVSTPEMIVDLPSCLASDHRVQVETLLEGLDVQFATWDSGEHPVIKWRRKVKSRFDEDLGRWEPIPAHVRDEKHVLTILNADDFVSLVTRDGLDGHVGSIREKFPHHHIMYLLQGMTPWLRKNRNLRNRQFASGVRAAQAQQASAASSRGRSTANAAEYISEDVVEDALLRLQVEHDVFIHHTTVSAETARWVTTFTQHISTIPYRKQRDHATSAAGFCMESGQVRTGEDARDTYVRMLQEIVRITAPIAYGVAAEFDSVSKLVRGLEAGGPERLDKVQKSANKDGQLSDRTIGQAVSRRICKVFTGRDETSTDV
ncbi:alpha-1,2-mannosyltransferase (Alg2) [Purpureocillium lilacinum]|uniref:Alpha-1,2-mannosyltransferase (Alg2) n=2 Tax=Purpureocillium lilacinum TaxID=33203 RepID=A0A179HG76_PURLI|nr:alpha-1,2-mannosyltransferase (Alg2) [Purpureocillium lilacinum]OAQ89024.1 alpha-1,2-mannosyltransferase (Alg2) [Purpureocillium lilacinum]